jgi:hypothetical protein
MLCKHHYIQQLLHPLSIWTRHYAFLLIASQMASLNCIVLIFYISNVSSFRKQNKYLKPFISIISVKLWELSGYSLYLPEPKRAQEGCLRYYPDYENVIVKTIEPSITQYHNKMQTIQQKKIKINKFFSCRVVFFFTLARKINPTVNILGCMSKLKSKIPA